MRAVWFLREKTVLGYLGVLGGRNMQRGGSSNNAAGR